jgi:hypothetical protein
MNSFDSTLDRTTYVRRVLDSYRRTPTTAGRVRPADRRLAGQLYDRRVPLDAIQAAFHLAAARRIFRDFHAPPLAPIQSLHYFLPVLDEIRHQPIDPEYLEYLAWKVDNADAELQRMREIIAAQHPCQIPGG